MAIPMPRRHLQFTAARWSAPITRRPPLRSSRPGRRRPATGAPPAGSVARAQNAFTRVLAMNRHASIERPITTAELLDALAVSDWTLRHYVRDSKAAEIALPRMGRGSGVRWFASEVPA